MIDAFLSAANVGEKVVPFCVIPSLTIAFTLLGCIMNARSNRVIFNTAAAAKMLHESGRHDAASISSAGCANLYGLKKLDTRVQNTDGNFTRFICISKKAMIFPGADRISLMLSLPHRPGSLYSLISKFSVLGLNLTKLESRPIAGSDFEFMFYFDIEASVYSPAVLALLDELSDSPELFVFLGSYSEV